MTNAVQTIEMLDPKKLKPSPFNRRATFGDIAGMAASMREKGVLEPLCARPKGTGHELVFGHRRRLAAIEADLRAVPVMVRELSDLEVLEAMVIENAQREDIHPLEEADGFQELHTKHGYDVDTIAVKIGKSKAYVYGRLKLCGLAKEVRDALLKDEITAAVALAIGRIASVAHQVEALTGLRDEYSTSFFDNGTNNVSLSVGATEARHFVAEHFLLRLASAPFSITDPLLVPKAGACSACPKRTGAQPELFDDVKSPDTCSDPSCFATKKEAAWALRTAEAEKLGQKVLEGEAAKKALAYSSPYFDLSKQNHSNGKSQTNKELLGKVLKDLPVVLVRDEDGEVHELVTAKAAAAALEGKKNIPYELEMLLPRSSGGGDNGASAAKRAEAKRKIARVAYGRALARVAAAAEEVAPSSPALILFLVRRIADESQSDTVAEVLKRRGWEREKVKTYGTQMSPEGPRKTVERELGGLAPAEAFGLAIEILAAAGVSYSSAGEKAPAALDQACELFKVDLDGLLATAKEEAKAPAKDAKKAAAKPKAEAGTCTECGCTDDTPCDGGCAWADRDETLCTACAEKRDQKAVAEKAAKKKGKAKA